MENRGHGFKSRTGLNFLQALFSPLLKQCTLLRGSLSFTSLSAAQIYDFHIFLTVCCYCYCCYICTKIFVLPVFICFFSRITSTHLCIQLHVYPANSFNMHSLSDVKRVVFIYRCEFLERTTKQSIERSNQSRTTFNPELKFATLSGYSLLASISC